MSKKNVVLGLILVAIGSILVLNKLEIISINLFFKGWWTLFIIVPSFVSLFDNNDKTGSIIGILIGVMLLLGSQKIIDFAIIWELLLPVLLVVFGLSLIFKKKVNPKKIIDKEKSDYNALFSSQKIVIDNDIIKNYNFNCAFGGIECHIKKMSSDIYIESNSLFGGTKLRVPSNTNVIVKPTSIFGGVDNKVINNQDYKYTVYINSACLFGGLTIID